MFRDQQVSGQKILRNVYLQGKPFVREADVLNLLQREILREGHRNQRGEICPRKGGACDAVEPPLLSVYPAGPLGAVHWGPILSGGMELEAALRLRAVLGQLLFDRLGLPHKGDQQMAEVFVCDGPLQPEFHGVVGHRGRG